MEVSNELMKKIRRYISKNPGAIKRGDKYINSVELLKEIDKVRGVDEDSPDSLAYLNKMDREE